MKLHEGKVKCAPHATPQSPPITPALQIPRPALQPQSRGHTNRCHWSYNSRPEASGLDPPDPHARERHRVVGSLPEHRSTSPPAQGRPSHEVSLAPAQNAKHNDYDAPERPASHRAVTDPPRRLWQRKAPRRTPARRSCRLLVCEARRKRAREPVSPRARVDSETTRQLLPSHAPHPQL